MNTIVRKAAVPCLAALLQTAVILPLADGQMMKSQSGPPPGVIRFVEPNYPEMLKQRGISKGVVLVAVQWSEEGSPDDAHVLSCSDPLFGQVSRSAVLQWRRAPGRAETQTYELRFFLSGVYVVPNKMLSDYATESRAERKLTVSSPQALVAEPRPMVQTMPQFPEALRGRVDRGRVVLEFYIDESGAVLAPSVIEASAPEFAQSALAAVRHWRFEPLRQNGQPTVCATRWAFDFRRVN